MEKSEAVTARRPLMALWEQVVEAAVSVGRHSSRQARAARSELSVLILADANGATQNISFLRPLAKLVAEGRCTVEIVDEAGAERGDAKAALGRLQPTVLVLSRYAGGIEQSIVPAARKSGARIVYHIDDNLLAVPPELGADKFARYNAPKRIAALVQAMKSADFIYASTEELARQLAERLPGHPIVAGKIYCAHEPLAAPPPRQSHLTIGYMGTSGHAQDLEMVVPALERIMERHEGLRFETFGTIKMPAGLRRFASRTAHHQATSDYQAFMQRLAELRWHVGLAPVIDSPFNRCKADTKWVEYTAAGITVIASNLPTYDRCCSGGAGLLVADDGWEAAIERLIADDNLRRGMAATAQQKLSRHYAPQVLTEQVWGILTRGG